MHIAPGVVGAVVLPVTGAATGVAQVVRGIANQNEAAKAESEGKIWNHVRVCMVPCQSSQQSCLE